MLQSHLHPLLQGLDFPNVQHVINYDMPNEIEVRGFSGLGFKNVLWPEIWV